MDWDLSTLRQAKELPGDNLATVIQRLAAAYRDSAPQLRTVLDTGRIFRIPQGDQYNLALLASALLAIVLGDVSGYDPVSKKRQSGAIKEACIALEIDYQEVLRLTEYEDQIEMAFKSKA